MRLLVHVEGESEESFVKELLGAYLEARGFDQVTPRLVGNTRLRRNRGGIKAWSSVKTEIINHLKQDAGAVATLMVDFYALPASGAWAWPGRDSANLPSSSANAKHVEAAISADLAQAYGSAFNSNRFVPYVMMHEFEALLFSDCLAFARGIGASNLAPQLQVIRDGFVTPEDINDSPLTAPSKRITTKFPGYQKTLHGIIAALEIGIEPMRAECHHFNEWIVSLIGTSVV